jgi:hypothetical protein
MATIHFVKDGKNNNGESDTQSVDISIDVAIECLSQYQTNYYNDIPPPFNPKNRTADFTRYQHVVLEIQKDETNKSFPKQGYYFIIGLNSLECQSIIGIDGPTV